MKIASKPAGYGTVDQAFLEALAAITGPEYIMTDQEGTASYTHDYTEDLRYQPEAVVKPGNAAEIAAVLKLCHAHRVPVYPAGARTGLSGGMLPVYGGLVLATERLNKILELDTRNLQARVQPGIIVQAFQEEVEKTGLMYPVDPASRGSCFLGGNFAESSGGMRAVKYGITKDYVLDLEVALANGELIRTGARVLKNSTGYNLTQLMVGSEGTLGIITEATLKLVPLPSARKLLLAPFARADQACDAVSAIFHAKVIPSAIEFMEREAIELSQQLLQVNTIQTEGYEAQLLIEVDGNDQEQLFRECEGIFEVLEQHGSGEVLLAESQEEMERLWRIRRSIGEATKMGTLYKEEDTVVPRGELAKLWRFVKETGRKYGFIAICYGHAGDGNLHVNILKKGLDDHTWNVELPKAIREIFHYTKELGGTLSGEHGIGLVQKEYMDIAFNEVELGLMKGIKAVFDPKGILNPGKMFPGA